MTRTSVLIVDDEKGVQTSVQGILEDAGYKALAVSSGEEALEMLAEEKYPVVLLDIWLPGIDGLQTLAKIRQSAPEVVVIMISGHGSIETAVRSTKLGAFDFVEKPLSLEKTLLVVKNAFHQYQLEEENRNLRKQIEQEHVMIGDSVPMQALRQQIAFAAPTNGRVLICGENGTGKELVAHLLHIQSLRRDGPFVEMNCAAIPEELIESELFGHLKGSFTGASENKEGKFVQAHGGTLFLDEVGDMSLSAQAKVLRALQENKITRVGSDKDINVNVRIIAATNKNLKSEIEKNTFREDLYHRLSVILIQVPTLNERLEDIPLLAEHFNRQIAEEYGTSPKVIQEGAIGELQKINWTGNIREFRNVLERLIILCEKEITGNDVISFAMPISK